MRLTRYLLLAVVVTCTLAPPAFACRFCNDIDFNPPKCDFAPPPTNGCMLTEGGCTTATRCITAREEKPLVLWSIASVEVTHQAPAVPSRETANPVVASNNLSHNTTR
jgi:hypothetical protein